MVEQKNTTRRSRVKSRMANDPLEWAAEKGKVADPISVSVDVKQPPPIEEEISAMHENKSKYVQGLEDLLALVDAGDLTSRMDPHGDDPHCAPMVNRLMDLWEAKQNMLYSIINAISVNILLADKDYNIIYMNDALNKMFTDSENEIKVSLPHFSKDRVMGANMDIFHKNPAHQRKMMDALSETVRSNINLGSSNFNLTASPIFDNSGKRTYTVVEWFDNTALEAINQARIEAQQKEREQEKALLHSVLNSVSVNVQLADKDYNIVYMNDALQQMFASNEEEIKQTLPNFSKDQVMGANMDIFHKNPAHQRKMMDALSETVRSNINLGRSNFNLRATPIFDVKGERAYTVVEWFDNTALKSINTAFFAISRGDLNIELPPESSCTGSTIETRRGIVEVRDNLNMLVEDTNLLVNAALEGRLATRADSTRHRGEYAKIVDGINRTLDAVINPVNSLSTAIAELSNNNLGVHLEGEFHGDFLDVKNSYDNGLDRLNATLYQIVDAVEEMTQSAIELNGASQNMAASSQEQSSSVEEVTSSLEETDSQVKANTDNANTANQLVVGATETAQLGQKKMENMASAMEAINISAQNISKIIKVIDEIAFQTNLLALNAAVEAARAGQHGRGFAVVAQEVRNLAGRSAKAARETADLIEDSSRRVAEGVKIASETRDALDLIVTNVIKVKDLVAEIATASTEQSKGVSQINVAMNQVAKAAQNGSQQAEELSASSSGLNDVAERIKKEIDRFTLRPRQKAAKSVLIPGLENISPEMLMQIQQLLLKQKAAEAAPQVREHESAHNADAQPTATTKNLSPKDILPLDMDERGLGSF